MGVSLKAADQAVLKIFAEEVCCYCGTTACGWVITTCPEEHVPARRACADCLFRMWTVSHMCTSCNRKIWDWACKRDGADWLVSWSELHKNMRVLGIRRMLQPP